MASHAPIPLETSRTRSPLQQSPRAFLTPDALADAVSTNHQKRPLNLARLPFDDNHVSHDDDLAVGTLPALSETETELIESMTTPGLTSPPSPLDWSSRSRRDRLQLALPVSLFDNSADGLVDSSPPTSKYLSTGTTIAAVRGPDFVVLGADTRATAGTMVADTRACKIHEIANNVFCCGAGTSADLQHVTRQAKYTLQLMQQQETVGNKATTVFANDNTGTNSHVSVERACRWLQETLYEQGGACQANLIVGGVYNGCASLVSIYPHGSMDTTLAYTALGSGGLAAMSVLESRYKATMDRDQVIALVKQAILAGIRNDLGSGSQVDLCIISADGTVEYLRGVIPEEELVPVPKVKGGERSQDEGASIDGVNGFGNLAFRVQSKRKLAVHTSNDDEWNDVLGIQ